MDPVDPVDGPGAAAAPHRVFVLGAGRAGRSIAAALESAGRPVTGLHGRRPSADGAPAYESHGPLEGSTVGQADVVLVTVRDAEMDAALAELAPALAPGAVVLHASGATDPAQLAALRRAGHPAGTFHPLVPLSDPAQGADRLRGAWIGVDGDPAARQAAAGMAAVVGAHVLDIPAGARPAYHAAAVFASNFPVVLAGAAATLLREAGVAPAAADGAVLALLAAAAENVAGRRLDAPGVAAALTGPVARGDAGTVAAHLRALADRDHVLDAYVALSRLAVDAIRAAGTDAPRLDEVLGVLEAGAPPCAVRAAVSARQ